MTKILTGKHQKKIAWILFFIFYGELAGTVYASKKQILKARENYRLAYLHSRDRYASSFYPAVETMPAGMGPYAGIIPGDAEMIKSEEDKHISVADKKDDEPFIGGPGQPEMSTFKSVGADNMVNLFTGDFSYSIPLADVAGYPVNLFYSAGTTMDQEASWVGLGWNINPGTISRNMRGLPDDFNGIDTITKEQSIKPDVTVGVTGTKGFEIVGFPGSVNVKAGIFYNNRRGLGLEAGVGAELSAHAMLAGKAEDEKTAMDTVTDLKLSGGVSLNSQQGMSANLGFSISKYKLENETMFGLSTSVGYHSRQGLTDLTIGAESNWYKIQRGNLGPIGQFLPGSPSVDISFARSSFTPSIRMPLTRFNQMYVVKLGSEKKVFFNNVVLSGYVHTSKLDEVDRVQQKPAYGYMYYEKANNDQNALIDFNRLNDRSYTYKTPVLSLPVYTYDVFSINGEGTGGSFRGYRGNMGYVRDNYTKTRTGSINVMFDIGFGDIVHVGTTLGGVFSPTIVEEWKQNNMLRHAAAFNSTDSIYQGFYFKNPGEKAIIDEEYYQKMGEDQLMRPYLLNTRSATPSLASGFQVFDKNRNIEKVIQVNAGTRRKLRDKRTQVITCLTAFDADLVGLDKMINSYTENTFEPGFCKDGTVKTSFRRYNPDDPTFYRKRNHISEIDVLETNGQQYIYGLPVSQIMQKEVSFSTESTSTNQLVPYTPGNENSVNNKKGRDGFYQAETMKGYAHSFLLTGILSPDYVDVRGDGITDDDLGTAVKFNYSRVNRIGVGKFSAWNPFKWRMPVQANTANYNEGLKADKMDDKGLYTYGEKELWYLHSIESKNMVATFRVSERSDGKQVIGENGGIDVSSPGLKKLDRIDLYTKADFTKYGSAAKPVKTVHFRYSYQLCQNYPLNANSVTGTKGKLTLDSLWFTYNGNERQKKNKYVFKYSEARNGISTNPAYNSSENDRWGNYKSHTENPNDVPNSDFPYTIQDTTTANAYASAWGLEKILLPGGGLIQVQYESDDYAYVQNKRASQMTRIAGFGENPGSTPVAKLYTGFSDHKVVFFDVDDPIADTRELGIKYMQDFKQLLLKIWVLMPAGNIGNQAAYEPVTVYGAIKRYGLINSTRFYVELEETRNGGSPIMETVLQFIKDYLPHRAYPGYEVKGDGALVQLVRSVWGLMSSYFEGVMGFEKLIKVNGKCRTVNLNMSFARLNNPDFKKIGGGHRVKRVVISDNWKKMTKTVSESDGMPESFYGQEYDYTTVEEVNGVKKLISSGVATYEPGVGNEENPFREVLKYQDKQPLGPTNQSNIEMPVAETFFPSPVIGYSKVTVKSIHNKDNKKIKSGVGLQRTEFYTTRDFPVISDFTSFDPQSRHQHKPSFLNKIFNFNKRDYLTLTQGFRVVLNDMNGKMKSQTSYPENDSINPVNYTSYHYRMISHGDNKNELDNLLPVISGPDGKISTKLIGKELEVMNDFREHFSYTYAANIPLNADIFRIGIIPIILPSIFRANFRDESRFRSATTLKVVNEYGILDSVVNIDKGSFVSTKNLVYDAESGDVLLSRTNNEFNKPVYQFNYPAWWVNTGMEHGYKNIDLIYKNVLFRNGRIEESPQVNMNYFESGDELYVRDMEGRGPLESDGCVKVGYPAGELPKSDEFRIWAVDMRKDLRNGEKQFIFLDRYGVPYNAANATIRIIRSGKRNLASASVGSVVSLANPIRTRDGIERIIIDDTTDVINSGVVEFKERWRANDQFYAKDTTIVTVRKSGVKLKRLFPENVYSAEMRRRYDNRNILAYRTLIDNSFEITKYRRWERVNQGCPNCGDDARITYDQNSWIKFDMTDYPELEGSTVTNAVLNLTAHTWPHQTPQFNIGIHGVNQAHNNPSSSDPGGSMTIKLSRMLTPWYSNTDNASWQNIFFDNQSNSVNDAVTYSPNNPPINGTSNRNLAVDVTRIAKGFVANYANTSIAAGIKMSFLVESRNIRFSKSDNRTWRYCFNVFDGGPHGEGGAPSVSMDVYYYKCTPDDTIVYEGGSTGAPTTPPPGYLFCTSAVTETRCYSVFSKLQMNPYVEGVLGNWRSFRSYVYYGERRESDPTDATDIRKDGIIKDFEPYWAFSTDSLERTGSDRWVWNSEITQYNRKGAELENHDPLDRYNAGIYGYQETLPVAVVNNSRLRLSAFDGFEDYQYKDEPCDPVCQPAKRHFTTGITENMLVDTMSHTGKYSVRIGSGATHQIDVKVSDDDTVASPDIRIKMQRTPYSVKKTTPKGIGITGYYYNHENFGGTAITRLDDYISLWMRAKNNSNSCAGDGRGNLPDGITRCGDISVRWKGTLQVAESGWYEFDLPWHNNQVWFAINDTLVRSYDGDDHYSIAKYLNADFLYEAVLDFKQNTGEGNVNLTWKKPGTSAFVPIDPIHFYPDGQSSLADGSVVIDSGYCEKLDTIQAINHHLIDSFNLIPGKKMVASVWMRQGGQDCKCEGYLNNFRIRNEAGDSIAAFKPKERIIEGWQQFEAIFTVPEGSKIQLDFRAVSGNPVYIDDLRLHPFNANMKSFVYDPFNLRLSAELDENNYASFYEYDDEGTLIRVKKETKLGIKTITETRSSLQKNIDGL
jgi:hypothetical protein